MPSAEFFFSLGCGLLTFIGFVHGGAELVMGQREAQGDLAGLREHMQRVQVDFPDRKVSVFRLMRGYSLMMGLCLAAIGAAGLLVGAKGALAAAPVLIAFTLLGLVVTLRYFFVLPIATMGSALAAFVAWVVLT